VSNPVDTGNVTDAGAAPVVDATEPALVSAVVSYDTAMTLLQLVVPDTSAAPSAGPADTLLALATSTDASGEVPGSATITPVATASNAAPAIDPTTHMGDVIAFYDEPSSPAPDLFTGTHYTDYGVMLSSDTGAAAPHVVSPADAASAPDTLVPVVADLQKPTEPPPDILTAIHPIDHLAHAIL
jgi:hypothetical protein